MSVVRIGDGWASIVGGSLKAQRGPGERRRKSIDKGGWRSDWGHEPVRHLLHELEAFGLTH